VTERRPFSTMPLVLVSITVIQLSQTRICARHKSPPCFVSISQLRRQAIHTHVATQGKDGAELVVLCQERNLGLVTAAATRSTSAPVVGPRRRPHLGTLLLSRRHIVTASNTVTPQHLYYRVSITCAAVNGSHWQRYVDLASFPTTPSFGKFMYLDRHATYSTVPTISTSN
jgi:hypothetical protein